MSTRTLLFGATWCDSEEKRALAKLWARVLATTSPECDVLVIDCNSPFRPGAFLVEQGFYFWSTDLANFDFAKLLPQPFKAVASFIDNIGHLSLAGGDGWGRSFCKGLEIAMASGYDYVAYIEPDLLFAPPVMPIVDKMHRSGVKVAAPLDLCYHFIANEIMFFNVDYLRQSRFVERYDWANPPPMSIDTVPERRCEKLVADDLFILPIRGMRNDHGTLTRDNILRRDVIHPMGLQYLTHCRDFGLYEMFLQMHGLDGATAPASEALAQDLV